MKVKKENVVSCGKKNPTEREVELQLEVVSLKRQIGGLKTSNANYKKQVEELKAYKKEGEVVYEEKNAECEYLKKELEMANFTNDELRGQIASYNNQILDYNDKIAEYKQEIEELNTALEYERKPWWKKLF